MRRRAAARREGTKRGRRIGSVEREKGLGLCRGLSPTQPNKKARGARRSPRAGSFFFFFQPRVRRSSGLSLFTASLSLDHGSMCVGVKDGGRALCGGRAVIGGGFFSLDSPPWDTCSSWTASHGGEARGAAERSERRARRAFLHTLFRAHLDGRSQQARRLWLRCRAGLRAAPREPARVAGTRRGARAAARHGKKKGGRRACCGAPPQPYAMAGTAWARPPLPGRSRERGCGCLQRAGNARTHTVCPPPLCFFFSTTLHPPTSTHTLLPSRRLHPCRALASPVLPPRLPGRGGRQ